MRYFDHAATTPLAPEVFEAMRPFLVDASGFGNQAFGNPSSLHQLGQRAKQALDAARQEIANCLNTHQADSIIFTGSGTESDNLAVLGVARTLQHKGKHMITSQIEHAAVLNACQHLETQGWQVTYLPVDAEGVVQPEVLEAAVRPDTTLVSIMAANNEIGTLQPIHALGSLLKARGVLFHTDAVQWVGKLPVDLSTWPVDYLSFSGHKLYGPKGIGALFIRPGAPKPEPLVYGGAQEFGLRSGTQNVAAIVGIAKALQLCVQQQTQEVERLQALQTHLIEALEAQFDPTLMQLNGPRDVTRRVPGNVHVSFTGPGGETLEGEALVLQLDLQNMAASSGSACHSGVNGPQLEPSHVIVALGKDANTARGTLRLSMGRSTTPDDVDALVAALLRVINRVMGQPKNPSSATPKVLH